MLETQWGSGIIHHLFDTNNQQKECKGEELIYHVNNYALKDLSIQQFIS